MAGGTARCGFGATIDGDFFKKFGREGDVGALDKDCREPDQGDLRIYLCHMDGSYLECMRDKTNKRQRYNSNATAAIQVKAIIARNDVHSSSLDRCAEI